MKGLTHKFRMRQPSFRYSPLSRRNFRPVITISEVCLFLIAIVFFYSYFNDYWKILFQEDDFPTQ